MRLATVEEHKFFIDLAKFWTEKTYKKYTYETIGLLAEFMANKEDISLYNQSLKGK